MKVKNYYAMNEDELAKNLQRIRGFFFDYPNHPQISKARLALDVALCAKTLRRDDFVILVIDSIC